MAGTLVSNFTDEQLFQTQLALALACGRSKSSLKSKHRQRFCDLFLSLKLESDRRGKAAPQAPFRA